MWKAVLSKIIIVRLCLCFQEMQRQCHAIVHVSRSFLAMMAKLQQTDGVMFANNFHARECYFANSEVALKQDNSYEEDLFIFRT